MNLQVGDIVFFKNGNKLVLNEFRIAIIEGHYTDNLECIKDDTYTITKVIRPTYETLFERGKDK